MQNADDFNAIRLIVLDFGGVLRDSSLGLDHGYRVGFESEGLPYGFRASDTWHLRGIGKFDIAIECIKVLLSLQLTERCYLLPALIERDDAESAMNKIVQEVLGGKELGTAERIRLKYKEFFNSPPAGDLVSIYPGARQIVVDLSRKGYEVALLTNGNRVTVERDLPFAEEFDLIVSEDEVANKKPSGDGIARIMAGLGRSCRETVFICDAPNDIHAARDARVMAVALLGGMGTMRHLASEGPDYLFTDLADAAAQFPSLVQSNSTSADLL